MCAEPRRGSGLEAEEGPGAEARGGVSSQEGRVIGKARRWGAGDVLPEPSPPRQRGAWEPPGGPEDGGLPGARRAPGPPLLTGADAHPGCTPLSKPPGASLLSPPLWVASCWGASEPQHPLRGLSSHHGKDSGSQDRVTRGAWESHERVAEGVPSFTRTPAPRLGSWAASAFVVGRSL